MWFGFAFKFGFSPQEVMFHENEDGVCSDGSSCGHMFAPSVRVKNPVSCVKCLYWLYILLVILLAGQASCNQTSAAPSPLSATTNAPTSVYYFVDVTVDVNGERKDESEIKAWLIQVFQNNLGSCRPRNHGATTAPPTSPQTTSASNETTLMTTATTLQSNNTTTAALSTVLISNTTTAALSTALISNTTTTATSTALISNTTTAAASTALISNTTTAAASTALTNNTTITAASTALISNTTTAAASTALTSNTTIAAASTALTSNTTIAAASTALTSNTTIAAASTALTSNTTIAAASTALTSNTTIAAASTALTSNTATAASSAASETSSTTAAAKSTASETSSTTITATSTALKTLATSTAAASSSDSSVITPAPGGERQIKPQNKPNPNSNKPRIAREINRSVTQSSGISNDNTTGLFQSIEINCDMKRGIRKTRCSVMLELSGSVPSCCILRTLCAASKASSDIQVVGKKADERRSLLNQCNGDPQEENSCTYTGQTGASCETSGTAYVVPQSNSTHCDADKLSNCSCSAYCNGTDAYYTFQISIKDPRMNSSYVVSLISKIKQQSCSPDVSCPLSIIASTYKDANMTCGNTETNLQSCRVILAFARDVPICLLAMAVWNVFQPEKQIGYNRLVTRAAICGDSEVSGNPLKSQVTWDEINLKPTMFCMVMDESTILDCQGENVVVLLEEQCVHQLTTPGPNVTTAQPNTTTSSVNVTSSQPNTTAAVMNATTTPANITVTTTLNTTTTNESVSVSPNVTAAQPNTSSVNVTSSPLNTTAQGLNATTTAATSLKSTTTTTNESVTVNSSEGPATTESADSQANALLDLTKDVSNLNSSQVDQLVSQLENLLSGPTVSLALGNTSVHIVSNLLGASPETLSDASNRIIGIVDTVALKLVLNDQPETLLSPAVALSVKPADGSNFQETFFSISDPSNVQVRGDSRLRRSLRKDSSIPQGSIRLPPSLTQDLTSEQQQLATRVQFNFYQKSTVFQDRSLGQRRLNSGILGASVANLSISGLQDDVVIHLRNTEPVPANFVARCVFWDFTLNDGSGGWNSSGCFVRNSTDNETVCSCNHLTSFAILLDLSREPLTSRVQATILTFITYIGCGISAIFLSVTLLTYLAFGKLRKDIPSKILIQLCLSLLLLNLVFLVDAWLALYPNAVGLCISTAWFLHYFLLVAFTWMGLEAVHMYLALVKVFNTYISRYMLKFSLVGWGVPMIVVIIVIAIDKDNYGLVSYGRFSDGTSDDFCWLKNDIAFYVAVVAYFCVIFLFNLIMFIVVLIQLCRIKRQNPHNALHRTTLQDARSVAGITILLGLTWGFAFFAWGPLNLPFMYLFAIFNSLQGFFIFVFHCAVKENVRRQWRTYLCCGRMRLAENSEWSRTATQKTVKKSSVTRLTSLHSSESSKSNSSSSFLVSDSSEQINGISSPFEDRQITADEDPSMDVILNEINRQYRNQQAP